MNAPVDRRFYTDYEGKRVYFACSVAIKLFHDEPVRYWAVLQRQGVALDDAPGG